MSESKHDPGAALKAAREAINVSAREIADALNLPVRVVEAIEDYDAENLPAPVFTRGYIRAYSKLLELDPEPIVLGYEFDEPFPKPAPEGRFEVMKPVFDRKQLMMLVGGALVALALLVSLIMWLWPDTYESVTGRVEESPVAILANANPVDSAKATPEPDLETPLPIIDETLVEPIVVADAPDDRVYGRRITELGDDEMWFQFTEDCWVEIKNTDGANLYSDLSRAGQDLRLVGQGPFRILLGYAPGVQMQYNGEVVSLLAHTRNNVASLVLGQ